MVSLLDEFPRHPEIHYTVNEKINAIAPKITAKGASSIKENIQKSFLDSVNRVLMEKLNLVGFDLKNSKQSVYSLIDFVHDARTSLDHLDQKIDKMLELSYRSRFRLEEIYSKVPEVKTNINDVQSTLSKSSLLAQNSLNFLNTTPEKIKGYKSELQTIANDIDGEFSRILDKADQKNQNFAQDLQRINPKLSQLEQQVGNQAASLQQVRLLISGLFPGAPILTKLDAAIAENFDLYYIDQNGAKVRPYIVHRTSLGCYERTLAWLIEKYAGKFPTWLCPEQVRILPISDKYADYANSVLKELKKNGVDATVDTRTEKIGFKIRDARLSRLPYMLVVGEKEEAEGSVSVRSRFAGDEGVKSLDDFIEQIRHKFKQQLKIENDLVNLQY